MIVMEPEMLTLVFVDALKVHDGSVGSLQFSPTGDWLASASQEWHEDECEVVGVIKIWDFTPNIRMSSSDEEALGCMSLSQDGNTVVWGCYSGVLRRFNGPTWREIDPLIINSRDRSVDPVYFTSDGKLLLAGVDSDAVRVWNASNFEVITTITTGRVGSLAISPDCRMLAVRVIENGIHLWDIPAGQKRDELPTGESRPGVIAFAPSGKQLAVAGLDGSLDIWNLLSSPPTQMRIQQNQNGQTIQAIGFLPSGEMLTGDERGIISIWDISQGRTILSTSTFRRVHSLTIDVDETASVEFGDSPAVTAIAISSNGEHLAIGNSAGGVQLFAIRQ
jgi:WD40 repeat protein